MAPKPTPPRGIRNHNPGNIERTDPPTPWQGLAPNQSDSRFVVFAAPRWGIRALARVLISYQDKHNLKTVDEMIARWAPPVENDTRRYADFVRDRLGRLAAGSPVDIHTYTTAKALVEAIITKENGVQPYSDAEIDDGLRLAGIEPPPRPLAESRTIQGSTVAVGGAAVALVTEAVRAAEPAIPLIQQIVTVAPWAVSVLILAGAAYAAYARYDDWRSARR